MTTKPEVLAMAEQAGIKYRHTPVGTNEMWCYDDAIERFHALAFEAGRKAADQDRVDAERWRYVKENIQIGSGAGGMDMWKIVLPDPGTELDTEMVFAAAIDRARSDK